jgi:hypothetical protein
MAALAKQLIEVRGCSSSASLEHEKHARAAMTASTPVFKERR